MTFFGELKRRNVIRVALFYAVSSWLVLQVADVLFGLLTVPEWTLKFVLGLLLLGFPFALVISWIYEMTPEGIKLEKDIDRSRSITHRTGRKLDLSILVVLIVAIGLLGLQQFRSPAPGQSEISAGADPSAVNPAFASTPDLSPSIAVLPFVNMSSDSEQGYFSDGLSDTLIHVLAQIDGIKVAARTSSFAYKGKSTDVRTIASELGVNSILEGSVQKAGSQLRIIAQLIDASDGSHLWSKTFDRSDADIFSIQDEISREVVTALKGTLLSADESELAGQYQPSLEAYKEFIQGRELMALRTGAELKAAEDHFRRALNIDPEYALAMVNLGDVLVLQVEHGDQTLDQVKDEADSLYQQALALNPNLGEAYTSMASRSRDRREFDLAESQFQHAIELNPNYSTAYHWYGIHLAGSGRMDEAETMMRKAAALDPLSDIIQVNLAYYALERNEPAVAEQIIRRGLARNPDFVGYYSVLADLELSRGNVVEALQLIQMELERNPDKVQTRAYFCILLAHFPDLTEANVCIEALAAEYPGHSSTIQAQALQLLLGSGADSDTAKLEAFLGASALLEDFLGDSKMKRHFGMAYPLAILYQATGRWEAARTIWAEFFPELFEAGGPQITRKNFEAAVRLADIQLQLGNLESADTLLDAVLAEVEGADRTFGISIGITDAYVHAIRGQSEQALVALGEAVGAGFRKNLMLDFKFEPLLRSVRSEPEFQRLAQVFEADMVAQQQQWRQHESTTSEI